MFGRYSLPENLQVGGDFYGYTVESFERKEHGVIWWFAKNNHGLMLPMTYDDFFDLLVSPHKREEIIFSMQEGLTKAYAAALGIVSIDN